MSLQHHIDDSTVVSFAAGTLPGPIALVVSAHLSVCETCRERVRNAEAIGSAILDKVEPKKMSPGAVNNLLERLELETREEARSEDASALAPEQKDNILPSQVRKVVGVPIEDVKWKRIARGVRYHMIDLGDEDKGKLYLMKIAAGRVLPSHNHGGSEVTLVLSGSYSDRFGKFGPGDIADLDDHAEHQPVVDQGAECICIVASDQPAKFKGVLPRIFQPFIGI